MSGVARPGFALATALFTLVVVGALVMGTLFAATTALRSGTDAIHQARAVMAAELGLERTIATWSRAWNGAFARGFGRGWSLATPEGARMTVRLTRLADELFLVSSDARAGRARRQVGRVVRLSTDEPVLSAALRSLAPIDVRYSAGVDGADRAPAGWDCPPLGPPVAPFAISDSTTLLSFGRFAWNSLTAAATTRLTSGVVDPAPRSTEEECDTEAHENWGEPMKWGGGACTSHYPVVHTAGDLIVNGGRGQGLLLVDGNLTLRGGFEFFGVVLVRGALLSGVGGARITGAVALASQGPIASSLGSIAIDFSRCAARKALLSLAFPVPVMERSWYEVFDPN